MKIGRHSAFGELLRQHRTAAQLTQEELAERAGLSVRGLVALENGERLRPRPDTTRLLADALRLAGETRRYFEAVARGRDELATRRASARETRPLPPLVGRASELERLEWHLAGHGPPVLVLAGEPGIGKTRLLRQTAERAAQQGKAVLAGGCQRRSGQEPYTPFPQAIARHLETLSSEAVRAVVRGSSWLVRLLPELTPLFPEPVAPAAVVADQERRLLFDAVARLVAHLTPPEGAVLVLDDLQWAPTDALDLLTALVRDPAASHLRVVCAYRNTDIRPADPLALLLADLAHAGLAAQLLVEPLSPKESEQMLTSLAVTLDPQSHLLKQAAVRTGGVPFYLVSYAQELAVREEALSVDVPWNVAHSLRQRIAALPPLSASILEVASVVGRVVPRAVLAAMMGGPDEEVLAGLEAACSARLLEEADSLSYQFPHDVIREVIEAGLGAARRALLHRRLGEVLEQLPRGVRTGGSSELAWHFLEGDDVVRALRYSLLAGDEAEAGFAHVEAEHHYRTAIDLACRLEDDEMRSDALHRLGMVLTNVGRLDEALDVVQEEAERRAAAGNLAAEARAVAQIGRIQEYRGAIQEGIARVEPLLQRLEQVAAPDPLFSTAQAELLLALGDLYYEAGRYPDQLRAAERALELGRQLGKDHLITDGARQTGLALSSMGRHADATRVWADVLPLMETTGDLYNLSHTLNNLSMGCSDPEEGAKYVERALQVAERLGDPGQIAFMTSNLAGLAFIHGRWDEARALAEHSWELSGPRGVLVSAYPALLLGAIDLAEGNVLRGRQWLETCLTIAKDSDLQALRQAQQALAEQDLLEGHADSALARLAPLLDRPGLEEIVVTQVLPTVARAYLELGDPDRAGVIASEGLRRAKVLGAQEMIIDVLVVQGAIAARRRRWEEAECCFDEATTLARRMSAPFHEGRSLYEWGMMLTCRGEPAQAQERLEEALRIFHRLHARPGVERTTRALMTVAPSTFSEEEGTAAERLA